MEKREPVYVGVTMLKRHLERYLREAAEGRFEIVVMRRNSPIARVIPTALGDTGRRGDSEKGGFIEEVM